MPALHQSVRPKLTQYVSLSRREGAALRSGATNRSVGLFGAQISPVFEGARFGFDDFERRPHLSPPLSMVRAPAAEPGSAAAKALKRRIRGAQTQSPESILLPAELILRKSTGSPRELG